MDRLLVKAWPDAAEALSVRRSKIWELMATGELESVNIGHSRLVPRDALDAYIRKLRGLTGQDDAA